MLSALHHKSVPTSTAPCAGWTGYNTAASAGQGEACPTQKLPKLHKGQKKVINTSNDELLDDIIADGQSDIISEIKTSK